MTTQQIAAWPMTPEDQEMRIMAYSHGELLANCEECGTPIPIELSKCADCAWEASHD